jgi:hypothetical protein
VNHPSEDPTLKMVLPQASKSAKVLGRSEHHWHPGTLRAECVAVFPSA